MNLKSKIAFYSLCALMIFLPFSSWAVSLTGHASASLVRDFLITLLFLLALPTIFKRKWSIPVIFAVILIFWGLISYFWREASTLQWLRGWRFTFMPIVLFVTLANLDFALMQKKILYRVIFIIAGIIGLISVLQLLGVNIPLHVSPSGEGILDAVHYVGSDHLVRLQAVLAGPNALALYLLAVIGFALGKSQRLQQLWLIPIIALLILTFSRSALIGLVMMVLTALFLFIKNRFGLMKSAIITILIALACAGVAWQIYKMPRYQTLVTHDTSSSLRVEQYKRIWQERFEIGWLGRGSGTAGPSSQFRLDNGANHWTENIYLDIFEELGFIGLLIFSALIASLLWESLKNTKTTEGKIAFFLISSFTIAGLFINYYTGQVGIFLMWLAASMVKLPTAKSEEL